MHIIALLHGKALQFLVLLHYHLLMFVKLWQEWMGFEYQMILEVITLLFIIMQFKRNAQLHFSILINFLRRHAEIDSHKEILKKPT